MATRDFVIIAGPTASGKSALALHLAQAHLKQNPGIIINADAMQVYRGLPILTAAPDKAMQAKAPHYLFAQRDPAHPYSVGQWLRDAGQVYAKHAQAKKRLAIFVGGSGLYIHAALHGISPIPPIPTDIRTKTRDLLARLGSQRLHGKLAEYDPGLAAATEINDRQRIVRGVEVYLATGRTLTDWQQAPRQGAIAGRGAIVYVRPPRAELYARINARFEAMLAGGVWDEIRTFTQQHAQIPPESPILKAVGLKPLMAGLSGAMPCDQAITEAKRDSRHYAKRQFTWFDHQLDTTKHCTLTRIESLLEDTTAIHHAASLIPFSP